MAIAFRSSSTANNGSASTISVTKPTGAATNDIWIVSLVGAAPLKSASAPTGWTEITGAEGSFAGSPADETVSRFWRRIDGTEGASQSFTYAGTTFTQGISALYSGCITTSTPIDVVSWNSSSGAVQGTTATATGVTVTNAASMLLFFCSTYNNAPPSSGPTSFTFRLTSDNQTMSELAVGSGATGNKTLTITNDYWSASLIALIPAASGGGFTAKARRTLNRFGSRAGGRTMQGFSFAAQPSGLLSARRRLVLPAHAPALAAA